MSKSEGPKVHCPECDQPVKLYRGAIVRHQAPPVGTPDTVVTAAAHIIESSDWWARHHGAPSSPGVRRLAADARLYTELGAVIGDVALEALAGKVVAR